jgi:hypothetical protein
MRKRDIRKLRQLRELERHPKQTQRHGTIGGYVTDGCRCDTCRRAMRDYQRARRASMPNARRIDAAAAAKNAALRDREISNAKANASPELTELIREQEKDNHYVIFQDGLVSLDAIWGDSDRPDDHYETGGLITVQSKRHGSFEYDPPWLPPLIEKIDAELALRKAA